MTVEPKGGGSLDIAALADQRRNTEAISRFLFSRLQAHVETLRPLLAPRRLLGGYVRSAVKEDVAGAERAFTELREKFKEVCDKPFGLDDELTESVVAAIENRVELYPWEYVHQVRSNGTTKPIVMTSPVRWILTYGSDYSFANFRQVTGSKGDRRSDSIRQFVVNALVMHLVLARYAAIPELLGALRFDVRIDTAPGLGKLPFVTVNACLSSLRPSDELILAATQLSGVPAFIELIDVEAVRHMTDPLKVQLEKVIAGETTV